MTVSRRQIETVVKRERQDETLLAWLIQVEKRRPKKRSECRGGLRPCPYVGCRMHLFLDVNEASGAIKMNFPGMEVWNLPVSCALDVAEEGGLTLEEVGHLTNLTRERIRQATAAAMLKLRECVYDFGMGGEGCCSGDVSLDDD